GPSQMTSILASKTARAFLERSPHHKIVIWWCPSHCGIVQNEFVDQGAKDALDYPQPDFTSYSVARQCLTARAIHRWHKNIEDASYRGEHNLTRIQDLRKCGASSIKHHPIFQRIGKSNIDFARVARFLSGHFPHGEFHEQNRAGHPSFKQIYQFLKQNPMLATFEWAELLQSAAEDQQRGRGPTFSQALVEAHTTIKVALYRMYCDRYGSTANFFRKYNASDVAHKFLNRLRPPGA
ncbi:hypothetical protein K474DRAFT_1602514, partial [Panus rudis PR-1116 ss-1]